MYLDNSRSVPYTLGRAGAGRRKKVGDLCHGRALLVLAWRRLWTCLRRRWCIRSLLELAHQQARVQYALHALRNCVACPLKVGHGKFRNRR